MSTLFAPKTQGAETVTFSNLLLQLGQRCSYTNFLPMPILRDQVRTFANPGIHELEKWLLGITVSMELRPAVGSYQYAYLLHEGRGIAVMHAGFDASGARQAWGAAHDFNQHCIHALRAKGSKDTAYEFAKFLQSSPELSAPTGPTMVTSLLPAILEVRPVLHVLEDFTRQLYWALHIRHTAGMRGSA